MDGAKLLGWTLHCRYDGLKQSLEHRHRNWGFTLNLCLIYIAVKCRPVLKPFSFWCLQTSVMLTANSWQERVTYHFLEARYPRLRPAGPVSTPHRMFAQVPMVCLGKQVFVFFPNICILTEFTFCVRVVCSHMSFTCRLFVLMFDFLCRKVGKVVVIKRVPHRLCASVPSCSGFTLVLPSISDTRLRRLGAAWLRWSTKPPKK